MKAACPWMVLLALAQVVGGSQTITILGLPSRNNMPIAETDGLGKVGELKLTLTASNSYSGTTTVSAGAFASSGLCVSGGSLKQANHC